MQHFSDKLMALPKWNDEKFTKDQLVKHLVEVGELISKDDPHQHAEIEDLINIAEVWQKQHLSSSEIDELIQKRFEKFMSKLDED
jgi:hypothetical protein